jgi:hypothetical protein
MPVLQQPVNWLKPDKDYSPFFEPSPKEDEQSEAGLDIRGNPLPPSVEAKKEWPITASPKPQHFYQAKRKPLYALCVLDRFKGAIAECTVRLDEVELTPVGFDAAQLRRLGLREGMRFLWWMGGEGKVRDEDIEVRIPQTPKLTSQEEKEYEELRQRRLQNQYDERFWEGFTGDGL